MIHLSALDANKALIEVMVDMVQGGILFSVVEGNTVTWRKCSDTFNLDLFPLGSSLNSDSSIIKAIQERKVINEYIPRKVYGKRLRISTIPILKEDNTAFGALSVAVPILHPVAASFDEFAPILAEMFYDGAVLYLSDLTKVAYRKASKKFDLPFLSLGQELKESDIPSEVIAAKKPMLAEVDESKLGVPVFSACFPLFDEENTNEIVATLGLIIPKRTAVTLREMSAALEDSLNGISSVIEQLAASATEIHSNEQVLNASIKDIITISNDINEVSAFIKRIADQTKMLGLNASIEAARAGEAGKGFGVVAEEIRKLSDQSKSTVPKIHKLTEAIQAKVEAAMIKSHNSLTSSEEQAAATEEITSSIEEITSMSTELTKIALEV